MKTVTALRCHLWVLLAIAVDIGVAVLVVITNKQDILLPHPKTKAIQTLQDYLPTFGALLGAIVIFINKNAITALMTVQVKRKIVSSGLTLKQLGYYDIIAHGGVPFVRNVFFYAVTVLLAVATLSPTIVPCLTPTAMNWGPAGQMPSVSFAAKSGVTPPIICFNGGGNVNLYGYGINCPMDSVFGEMFNAFTMSLSGGYPANSTYNGVSYPSSLIGISGAIRTLTKRYGDIALNSTNRAILPTDTFDTCIPRMVVSTRCLSTLPSGFSFRNGTLSVSGNVPLKNIQSVALCDSNSICQGPRFAPNYGNGVISVFVSSDTGSGDSVVTLFSVGKYASDLTSGGISCTVSAQEEFIPIRITGGLSASPFSSQRCENATSQPSPVFLANVTRIAGMALEKMQGQDGRLEAISYIPQGTDRIGALELGITRLVSIAATEMYSTIDALKGSNATWSNAQDYLYETTMYRLGVKDKFRDLFVLCPGIVVLSILVAWFLIGLVRAGEGKLIGFNPLDPGSAVVAGVNRDSTRLPVEIVDYSEVDPDILQKSDVLVRYGDVKGGRMGIEVIGGSHVQDGVAGMMGGRPMSTYKDESPMPSPPLSTPFFK